MNFFKKKICFKCIDSFLGLSKKTVVRKTECPWGIPGMSMGTAGLEEISRGVFSAMVGRDPVSDHLCRRGKVQKNDLEQVLH